jgi:hypothetical protein
MNSLCRILPPAVLLAAALAMLTAGCTPASPTAVPVAQTASATPASATPASPASAQPAPTPTVSALVTTTPVPPSVSPVKVTGSAVLPPGTTVYFAEAGDINGTVDYRPGCASGCQLSGDSTTFLWNMTWRTWTTVEAVGTGTEKIDDCDPDCASGKVYAVPVTVTFSDPVQAGCTAADTRVVWTRASFAWPDGLPAALTGQNAPLNPFTYPEPGPSACG